MSTREHPVDALARRVFGADAEALPFQRAVFDHIAAGRSVVLQAPTGAGKTFAALAPLVLGAWGVGNGPAARRMIYSLPLRVLAGSLREQYREKLRAERFGGDGPPLRFATQYGGSPEDELLDLGGSGEPGAVFTTIDQTLSGYLGVPISVANRRANILYGSILSAALVFDEVHLLEPEKSFRTALRLLEASPWPVLVMTATLSTALRRELVRTLDAAEVTVGEEDLPHIRSQHETTKRVAVETAPLSGAAVAERLGDRTLVICNMVARAQAVFGDLRGALAEQPDPPRLRLLHSRFLPEHREQTEALLAEWFGEGAQRRAVLVATQVVEAGLDISCDTMHTEASPADSFLQRIGRAARFSGESEAAVHVYPPAEPGAFLPYRKGPVLATLGVLSRPEYQALRFEHTQELIDAVHEEEQRAYIEEAEAGAPNLDREVHRVRRELDRAATKALVRHVDNVEIVVADPAEVERRGLSPYAYPSVGVRRSTFEYVFLKEGGQASAVEEITDEAGQGRGRQGRFFVLRSIDDGRAPASGRVVVPPEHASYDADLGLRLNERGAYAFEPSEEAAERFGYDYEEETYAEHVERVLAHTMERTEALDALRRLSASPRHPAISLRNPERAIRLLAWAHDVGKLTDGWQRAHGDRDLTNRAPFEPLAHGGRESKPPPHAAESAFAAFDVVGRLLTEAGEGVPLVACTLWAARTHHSPTTKDVSPYRIRPERRDYLRKITDGPLRPLLRDDLADALLGTLNDMQWEATADDAPEWLDRDQLDARHDALYALLVYILRRGDQLATSEVSTLRNRGAPPPTGGTFSPFQ